MKSLKAAAVVAGSLVIAGAAAPAFAHSAVDVPSSGLNGTVINRMSQGSSNRLRLCRRRLLETRRGHGT